MGRESGNFEVKADKGLVDGEGADGRYRIRLILKEEEDQEDHRDV